MLPRWLAEAWTSMWDRYWDRMAADCDADENCRKMRAAVEQVGREFEARPYSDLLKPAEELSFSRAFDGALLHFSAEAYRVDKNGDIHFCVDADGLPTKRRWKPSYQFTMRRDGTIAR